MKKILSVFVIAFIFTGCSISNTNGSHTDTPPAVTSQTTATKSSVPEATYGDRSGLLQDLKNGWWREYDNRKAEIQCAYDSEEISELEYLNALLLLEEEYYGWCSDEYNAVYNRIEECTED